MAFETVGPFTSFITGPSTMPVDRSHSHALSRTGRPKSSRNGSLAPASGNSDAHKKKVAKSDAELVLVEGQGSIHHPAYSGVTLALMHGACPEALILCHQAGRTHLKTADAAPAPRLKSLSEMIRDNERAASWVRTAPVLALSLNTMSLDDLEAKRAIENAHQLTGLPTVDPVRFGPEAIATELMRRLDERKRRASNE